MRCWVASSVALFLCLAAFPQERVQSPQEAATLEEKVAANPEDVQARSRLLNYYTFSSQSSSATRVETRRKHILWLIEHHPDAPVLAEPAGNLAAAGGPLADPEGVARATQAWQAQLAKPGPGSRVLMRAISFFEYADRAAGLKAVERGIQMYPNERYFLQQKGTLDAWLAAGVKTAPFNAPPQLDSALAKSADAERARAELLESRDIQLLAGSLNTLPRFQAAAQLPSRDLARDLLELTESVAEHLRRIDPRHPAAQMALTSVYSNAGLFAQDPAEKRRLLEKAVANAMQPQMKFYALGELAEAYLKTGDRERAAASARELLSMADTLPNDWNYGNAIHRGNLVLGRIALDRGDLREAKERLVAAGRTKGSPQLNSFGPQNWEFAQELLARGERTTVLEYLALCRNFWKDGASDLDNWSAAVRAGATPELGRRNPASGPSSPATQLVGKAAPPFVLQDLEDRKHALESYQGKVVLLDFWATWCEPCRAEMPDLEKLHKELSPEVAILALDADEEKDVVSTFIQEGKYTMPALLTKGTDVTNRYSINAYPTLVALDKTGRVSEVAIGGRPESKLREIIASARTGAPASAPAGAASTIPAPQTAEDFFRTGTGLFRERKLTEAEQAFTRALDLRNDWPQALSARAQVRYDLKRFDQCISDLNEAIRLRPKQSSYYNRRGLAYSYSGQHEKAMPDYAKAIELAPDSPKPYNARGWAYLELGRKSESLADLNRALDLDPSFQLALENRLRLYMELKEYEKAIADAEAVLRVNPGASWATGRIGEVRRLMNRPAPSMPAPTPLSPNNGEVFSHFPRNTTLKWSPVAAAVSYHVQVDYSYNGIWDSENGKPEVLLTVTDAEYQFDFVGAQPGRWRVRAVNADGVPGPFSTWRTFRYTR
jgi:tetratricopeptide (TPR) repeat protein